VITAATRVAAVLGDPVRHSLSPVLHNAAYAALGLDWVYVAFEVPAERLGVALDAVGALGLVGCSVTMPHKAAAAAACAELTPAAEALGSVNTVTVLPGGRLHGDSTDGEGLLRSLRDAGVDPAGAATLVLGAGGAARAVAHALAAAGAEVTVTARRVEAAAHAAQLASGETVAWAERDAAAAAADLVVNATPVGMGDGAQVVGPGALRSGQVVVDLVYHPARTPLLAAAEVAGATAVGGLGMLVHQAALQIEHWTGRPAPVAAMAAAAAEALAARA
jgi:shikimate dehydrogenase